jgi:hypothetical protein
VVWDVLQLQLQVSRPLSNLHLLLQREPCPLPLHCTRLFLLPLLRVHVFQNSSSQCS